MFVALPVDVLHWYIDGGVYKVQDNNMSVEQEALCGGAVAGTLHLTSCIRDIYCAPCYIGIPGELALSNSP